MAIHNAPMQLLSIKHQMLPDSRLRNNARGNGTIKRIRIVIRHAALFVEHAGRRTAASEVGDGREMGAHNGTTRVHQILVFIYMKGNLDRGTVK